MVLQISFPVLVLNIFLSPLFDCSSNIDGFLGNVFINYKLCLDMTCYEKIKKYFYNTFPKNYEKSHIKKTIKTININK